jgi:hypothetical protein
VKFKYASESPFWYFLAHRAADPAHRTLPSILDGLNERARELELPIVYKVPHALTWAVACQLFIITQPRSDILGRIGFGVMLAGFDRVLAPKGFVEIAFKRILGNIESPSFPGRERDDSIVDTFLANGLKLVDEEAVDRSLDHVILAACLSDDTMLSIGRDACRPPFELWDSSVTEYSRRRPGAFRRMFADPNKWLFD